MRARKPSSPRRANRALFVCLAVLFQFGCADDETTPSLPRPDVPAPTLATSSGRTLDGGAADGAAIEASIIDARGPLLDARMVAEAGDEGGLADARVAESSEEL